MKKFFKLTACGLMAAMLMTGCSEKAKEEETTAAVEATVAEVEVVADGQESVELGEYKNLEYTKFDYEVTDEDIEYQIQALLDKYPVIVEVDHPAEEGEIVNIDYVGKLDGEAFDGGTASGYNLTLGSNSFIDGFEDGLIGAEKGQKLDLNLTFPDPYPNNPDLAGKEVVFEVTVNSVKHQYDAELSDSFVAQYTQYTTVEEYRTGLKEDMEAYVKEMGETQMKNELYTQIVENSKVTVSESLVQAYFDELYKGYEDSAAQYSLEMDAFVALYGVDLETFKEQLNEMAKESARNKVLFEAIAEAESIVVDEQDRIDMAEELGYEDVEGMIETAGELVVENYILSEKVMDFLAENAVAVEAE